MGKYGKKQTLRSGRSILPKILYFAKATNSDGILRFMGDYWPFNFHFPKIQDVDICMILGTPKPMFVDSGPTELRREFKEQNHTHFWNILFPNSQILTSVWWFLENLEYGINIYQKAWNGSTVIRNKYSSKQAINIRLKLWIFETKKPRN